MQLSLRTVARSPAGLGLKPLKPMAHAAKATALVPNRASSYGLRPLLPRISHSSSAPLPAPGSVRGIRRRCPRPAPKTKARDEAEREPQQAPAAKQGEGEEAAAERKPAPPSPTGERSMAYQIFASLYVCAYVFCWRTGELIAVNAELALERLRRYVRDKFFDRER